MYDLSAVFGIDELSSVPVGSSLLVTGKDGIDTEPYLLTVLANGLQNGEGAILVTGSAPQAVEALEKRTAIDSAAVCVIEYQSGSEREQYTLENGVFVYAVPSPNDLTGIGIGLAECFDQLRRAGIDQGRVGFLSLSTVLEATSEKELFKFSHVVASRLASAGFLGMFALDTIEGDESGKVLREAFDGTIEFRETGETAEGRVTGREWEANHWQPLSPPAE